MFFDHHAGGCRNVGDLSGGRGIGLHFGQAEVEDLGVFALGDEDVRGLDVAVNDVTGVRRIESVGDLDPEGENGFQTPWPGWRSNA